VDPEPVVPLGDSAGDGEEESLCSIDLPCNTEVRTEGRVTPVRFQDPNLFLRFGTK